MSHPPQLLMMFIMEVKHEVETKPNWPNSNTRVFEKCAFDVVPCLNGPGLFSSLMYYNVGGFYRKDKVRRNQVLFFAKKG